MRSNPVLDKFYESFNECGLGFSTIKHNIAQDKLDMFIRNSAQLNFDLTENMKDVAYLYYLISNPMLNNLYGHFTDYNLIPSYLIVNSPIDFVQDDNDTNRDYCYKGIDIFIKVLNHCISMLGDTKDEEIFYNTLLFSLVMEMYTEFINVLELVSEDYRFIINMIKLAGSLVEDNYKVLKEEETEEDASVNEIEERVED